MLWLFHVTLGTTIAVPILLAPFLGLLGRRWWFFTAPRMRLIVVTVVLVVLSVVAVPAGPWTVGLGWGWLSNVAPSYFLCTSMGFGATGLLFGLIAPGQAAISQWLVMGLLLMAGGLVGCLFGLGLQTLLARFTGIRRKLKGGSL